MLSQLYSRNNDLENFFAPVLLFIKNSVLTHKQIPLWNPHIFSGTPHLPDPQSQIFYPGTLLFVFLPINAAFLVSLLLHALIGGVGMYLLCKSLSCHKLTCIFAAVIFLIFPRIFGYLEAGHWGLFTAYAWIPVCLTTVLLWAQKREIIWASATAIVLFFILVSHVFIYACAIVIIVCFYTIVARANRTSWIEILMRLIFLLASSFGLAAIFLLPQLSWAGITTRSILLKNPDIYPKWTGIVDIVKSLFWPFEGSVAAIWARDSEKWIGLGVLPTILAVFTFLQLKIRVKIALIIFLMLCFLLAFKPPAFPFVRLMRVSTRPWLFVEITVVGLCLLGFQKRITKGGVKFLTIFLIFVVICEYLFLSWVRISKPFTQTQAFPQVLLDTITADADIYRVYCTSRCIPQYTAVANNLELVEGYGTLQQENYFSHSWSLVGAYWNYYTLAIPPMGVPIFEKPQPSAAALGEYSTKYLLSEYELISRDLVKIATHKNITLYKNSLFLPRFRLGNTLGNVAVVDYTPNRISLLIDAPTETRLTFANVASPGWRLKIGKTDFAFSETPSALMRAVVPQGKYSAEIYYTPPYLFEGAIISLITIAVHILYIIIGWNGKKSHDWN